MQSQFAVADPGFPLGGRRAVGGGCADLRRGCFSAKTYAKTKELDPVGGRGCAPAAPPGSANGLVCAFQIPNSFTDVTGVALYSLYSMFPYYSIWEPKLNQRQLYFNVPLKSY